jgi:lysozyme
MANLTVIESTLALIREFEGYSAKAYWDVSRWSIAYGSGTLLNGSVIKEGDVVSKTEGEALLKRDATYAAGFVNSWVKSTITQGMFDALVSFTYNCGIGNFQKSNLLKLVNQNPLNFETIRAAFLESKFTTYGRTGRRKQEADVYQNGAVAPTNFFWLILVVALILVIRKK